MAPRHAAALAGALLLAGCAPHATPGSGQAATETRALSPFDAIVLKGVGLLYVRVGAPAGIEITGDDNLLALLETKVEQGRLLIAPREPIRPRSKLVYRVTTPALASLEARGALQVVVQGLSAGDFTLKTSGAVDATLAGKTGALSVHVRGAGSVRAAALEASVVDVTLRGSGAVGVHARSRLRADIAGAGSVRYRGAPLVRAQAFGGGSVTRLD